MGHWWRAGVEETCKSSNARQLECVFLVPLREAGVVGGPCLRAALGMDWSILWFHASYGRPQGGSLSDLGRTELWRWSRAGCSFDGSRSRQSIGYIRHQWKFGLNKFSFILQLWLFVIFAIVIECDINDIVFFSILRRFSFFFQSGSGWL